MTILVTGGAGFIGSHLVDHLVNLGQKDIVVLDNLSTGEPEHINPHVKSVIRDINATSTLDLLSHLYDFSHIFHLAALSRVEPSLSKPELAFETNVRGTMNLLNLAKKHNSKFIYAGSSTVSDKYKTPYGFTKYNGEELCKFYNEFYGVDAKIARFYNVYGPRQPESGEYSTVIGIFERQKKESGVLTVTGTGEQRRDFIHVSDIAKGLCAVGYTSSENMEPYFFGSGENHSINEIAKMFEPKEIKYIPARRGEAMETLCPASELKKNCVLLGWKPAEKLEDYIIEKVKQ